ncbi:hypothetical protein AHAS_Ahas10G0095300 [Arachis hypogaea]
MAQEDIIERHKKPNTSMVQVNLSQASSSSTSNNFDSANMHGNERGAPNFSGRGSFGRSGHGGRNPRDGRNSWPNMAKSQY